MSVHATRDTTHLSERSSIASHKQDDRKAYPLKTTRYSQENDEVWQRRADALRALDGEGFSWSYYFKVRTVAGVGFFTDAYDMFALNLASVLLIKHELTYGIELIIVITTTFVLAYSGSSSGVIGLLVVWWFVVRVLCGKEGPPLSAVIASEFASASTGSHSRAMPRLFTPQGWGNLADSLATLVNGFPRDARGSRNGRKTRAERRRERAGASGRPGSLQ